jgi:hypothetical protein
LRQKGQDLDPPVLKFKDPDAMGRKTYRTDAADPELSKKLIILNPDKKNTSKNVENVVTEMVITC